MDRVMITLEGEGLLELQAVLLDDDPVGALEFVKRHIAPRIPRKGTMPCDSSRLNPFILSQKQGRQEGAG